MLQTQGLKTVDDLRAFLAGSKGVEIRTCEREACYASVGQTLKRFGYRCLGKADPSGAGLPPITASIGFAHLDPDSEDPTALLRRADATLYRAKARGRNRVLADSEPA